jgi:hypothetical protein
MSTEINRDGGAMGDVPVAERGPTPAEGDVMRATAAAATVGGWARIVALLERERAWCWVVVLAVVLVLPSIDAGFAAADHILRTRAGNGPGLPGFPPTRLELFVFVPGDADLRSELMETGALAWWVAPGYRLAFLRPLSALTHALDFEAWPEVPALMHAHSIAWFVILLTSTWIAFRRLAGKSDRWVPALALLFYAVDDARGPLVGHLAHRNAMIAASFAIAALVAHDRWRRDGRRTGAVLSPVLLGTGLLAGETALGAIGYFVAYALFVDRGSRFIALLPALLVLFAWALAYGLLGYGARGSGLYVAPLEDPAGFAFAALVRAPVLLGAQFLGPWSDVWSALPTMAARGVYALSWAILAALGWLAWPLLRRDRIARFWTMGAVLAAVPAAAAPAADHALVLVGLGAAMLVARVLATAGVRGDGDQVRRRPASAVLLGGLVVVHGFVAPLLLPVRAFGMSLVDDALRDIGRAVPTDPDITTRTVVVASAPNDAMVAYLPFLRASVDAPAPAKLRLLATSTGAVEVARIDEHTLDVRPERGLLATPLERMLRASGSALHEGDTIELSDVTIVVGEVRDGRPLHATFRFATTLDDPSRIWLAWQGRGFAPWSPPAVGETATIPAVDVGGTLADMVRGRER